MSDWNANPNRYLYWVEPEKFPKVKSQLETAGFDLSTTLLTPCQVLHATGNKVIYAPSCVEIFNVSADDSRKLVNACPGSVTFGGAQRDTWVDVKPAVRQAQQ